MVSVSFGEEGQDTIHLKALGDGGFTLFQQTEEHGRHLLMVGAEQRLALMSYLARQEDHDDQRRTGTLDL